MQGSNLTDLATAVEGPDSVEILGEVLSDTLAGDWTEISGHPEAFDVAGGADWSEIVGEAEAADAHDDDPVVVTVTEENAGQVEVVDEHPEPVVTTPEQPEQTDFVVAPGEWTDIVGEAEAAAADTHDADPVVVTVTEENAGQVEVVDERPEPVVTTPEQPEQTDFVVAPGEWTDIVGEAEAAAEHAERDPVLVTTSQDSLAGADWTEIVGHAPAAPAGDSAEILEAALGDIDDDLGELVEKSSAFHDYAARRAAASSPLLSHFPADRWRDWQIDFGPVSAPAGESVTLTNAPQCLFRGEKVIATDTASPAGTGTRISTITVGQKVQRPAAGSGLTAFFANNALGNGIKWDTTDRALQIAVTVSFLTACTFDMSVFGKAVL